MFSHIHSTTVIVTDQSKALDFYTNTLGWETAMDNDMGGGMRWLTVVPPGAQTQLVLGTAAMNGDSIKPGAWTGITLIAPDIDATYEVLLAKGVKFKEPVQVMPWGQKATWFYDLDGNEFFLVAE
jgi:catechol 2,3-dioxygenase-like lactoylglutathione lyase family enzyme